MLDDLIMLGSEAYGIKLGLNQAWTYTVCRLNRLRKSHFDANELVVQL
jgi:hypothetical protein